MKKQLSLLAAILLNQTLIGQMISPQQGQIFVSPTNVSIVLPVGNKISSIAVYYYYTDSASGIERLEFLKQLTVPAANTTNVYQLNPDSAQWLLRCGDYVIRATYTMNGGTSYQSVDSGRIRILTDLQTITLKYPTIYSVFIRGETNEICWNVLAKPGADTSVYICLTNPQGGDCWNFAELSLSGNTPVATNVFRWKVLNDDMVNSSFLSFPDGAYELTIVPAQGSGSDNTGFRIDSEPTVRPNLSITKSKTQTDIQIKSGQAMGRSWWIDSTTDLMTWTQVSGPIYEGGSLSIANTGNTPSKIFFRARLEP